MPGRSHLSGRGVRRFGSLVNGRQVDFESGAAAGLAVYGDVAATLFHDPVDGRESEAGAFPRLLGGEERLEDLCERFAVHAAPVIGHGEQDVRTGREFPVSGGAGLVKMERLRFDDYLAAAGDGVAGVDGRSE